MVKKEFIYKDHAVDMMVERGISKKQVEVAIERGAKFKQTEGLLAKYSYYSVAYKIIGNKYIIKTVYID
tara:strand:- start:613 stop:819 length:207 start_codon:yes stop_codon:yes gene_type:complete